MRLLAFAYAATTMAMDNGVARTPPMGWLSWERFRCNTDCVTFPDTCIGENLFMEQATHLARDGWLDVGYNIVHIDDCWAVRERNNKTGKIDADPARFPHGMKALGDYIHKLGLKFGIYGDMGTHTCGGFPGSMGYEEVDSKMFASWGVDMLKYDGCYSDEKQQEVGYPAMSAALNATGRPIVYSCSWPAYQGGLPPQVNYTLLGEICNVWRNYGDIQDNWDDIVDIMGWWGDHSDVLVKAAGPGKWNDPDMLIGGNFALTVNQAKVQFGLWAIVAAPLFLSTDLRTMDTSMKQVLQNVAVIKVSQDPLGIQGRRVLNETAQGIIKDMSVWTRPLIDDEFAVAAVSYRTDGRPQAMHFSLKEAGLKKTSSYMCADLFDPDHNSKLFAFDEKITLYIEPDTIVMWRCYPEAFMRDDVDGEQHQQL